MTQELEQLIEAIIADGVITEKERRVLHAKALSEGISTDEIDVLVEGRLVNRQKAAALKPPTFQHGGSGGARRVESYGVLQKCPSCGSQVAQGAHVCSECGYEFRGINANSSVERLSQMLREAEKGDYSTKGGNSLFDKLGIGMSQLQPEMSKRSAKETIIRTFAVPTTREDLLEFILFTKTRAFQKSLTNTDELYRAYRSKYDECIEKARFHFPDDPQFRQLIAEDDKRKKQWYKLSNMSLLQKGCLIYFAFLIFLILIAVLLSLR